MGLGYTQAALSFARIPDEHHSFRRVWKLKTRTEKVCKQENWVAAELQAQMMDSEEKDRKTDIPKGLNLVFT